jgi:hypothetical protein
MRRLVLLFVLACSHPAPPPSYPVSVSRSYNDVTQSGEMVAHTEAAKTTHARLAAARAWLAIANALAATPAGSYQAASQGIKELGEDYAKPGTMDETNVKRKLAEQKFSEGDDQLAAEIMTGILGSRIRMYVRRYQPDVE